MKTLIVVALALWASLFSPVSGAVSEDDAYYLRAVSWVVYCEDNTDLTAAHLVLSTVFNRARSHAPKELYRAVSAKGQYHCHKLRPKDKQLRSKRFKEVSEMVRTFVKEEHFPSTSAKYFYNHKLVKRSALGKIRLSVVRRYGAHTYLV